MDDLAQYIREGIATQGFRNVFDNRLDQIWPPDGDRRKQTEQVCAFAARHGWRVTIGQNGKMATFRPMKSGQNGKP